MWTNEKVNGYEYWIKHFDEASDEYGLNKGRISKLAIKKDGRWVLNYDRGWDIRPDKNDIELMGVYKNLLKKYN